MSAYGAEFVAQSVECALFLRSPGPRRSAEVIHTFHLSTWRHTVKEQGHSQEVQGQPVLHETLFQNSDNRNACLMSAIFFLYVTTWQRCHSPCLRKLCISNHFKLFAGLENVLSLVKQLFTWTLKTQWTHSTLGVRSLMVLVLGPRTLTKVKSEYRFLLLKSLVLAHLTNGLESDGENSIFFMERQKETCVACLDSGPRPAWSRHDPGVFNLSPRKAINLAQENHKLT